MWLNYAVIDTHWTTLYQNLTLKVLWNCLIQLLRRLNHYKAFLTGASIVFLQRLQCLSMREWLDTSDNVTWMAPRNHYSCINWLTVEKKIKLVKRETHARAAYDGFLNDFISLNVTLSLNQDPYTDPNENYKLLHNHVTTLRTKHRGLYLQNMSNSINIDKGRQWITRGVMWSIRYKDRLYRDIKRTNPNSPIYADLKTKLNVYNKLLQKNTREAKKNYYENQFQSYKSDIRKIWGIISEILSKKHRNKSSIKSVVIDSKTVPRVVPAVARPLAAGLQYQPRQRRPYKWSISILPRSQFYKNQGKLAFSTSCPAVRPHWRLRNDAWRRDS